MEWDKSTPEWTKVIEREYKSENSLSLPLITIYKDKFKTRLMYRHVPISGVVHEYYSKTFDFRYIASFSDKNSIILVSEVDENNDSTILILDSLTLKTTALIIISKIIKKY